MAKKGLGKLLILAGVLAILFVPSFIRYQELNYKDKLLEKRIRAVQSKIKKLEEEKKRLEQDITYIEKRARQKMGVVRKGEIVLKQR